MRGSGLRRAVRASFHVGSGCFDLSAYTNALKQARAIFDMGIARGFNMKVLDIGGGFPGADDGALTFQEIANCIAPMLDQLFPSVRARPLACRSGRPSTVG